MRGWSRIGLRARLTLIASAALAVGLLAGSLLLLRGFETSRLHAIDGASRTVAANVANLAAAGALPPTLPVQAGQSAQVLTATGSVVAVSPGTSHTLPLVPVQVAVELASGGPQSRDVDQVSATGVNRVLVRSVRAGQGTHYVVVAESLQEEQATLHSLRRSVAIAAPTLLLLVGATLWLLLGRALGAVSGMGRSAAAITDPVGGIRLPLPDSHDEIRALAVTLNAMLERLAAAATRERQFVADVAHELRSPLAAMHTQLEVGLNHPDAATRKELLAGTLQDTERLADLVDDLLVLARLEAEPRISTTAVDVGQLVNVTTAEPQIVRGDRQALGRALDNLVANANRHATAQVVVSVERVDQATVEIRVDDDGPGVPATDRLGIFERFVRLDDARAREDGGSGLGLAIVQATAVAHGGSIRVEDSDLGGARFILSLPAEQRVAGPSRSPTITAAGPTHERLE
jgi:signal transduction histidine kinase